ncbi:MAG: hypothetical protein WCT32_05565 [Patescibacteria group bacterium]|jgi:hypothetical protein
MTDAAAEQPVPPPVTPEAGSEGQEAAKAAEFYYLSEEEIAQAIAEAKNRPIPPEKAQRISRDLDAVEKIRQDIIGLEALSPEERDKTLRTMSGAPNVRPVFDVLLGKPSQQPAEVVSTEQHPRQRLIEDLRTRFAGQEIGADTWEEVEEFVAENTELFDTLEAKIQELSRKPEYSRIEVKKKTIEICLLQSVVNGHLTKEDLKTVLEGGVRILSNEEISQLAKTEQSYEGIMYYDLGNRALIISESALVDEYRMKNAETGQERIIEIDIEHSINHEIAHGIVERGLLTSGEKRARKELREGKEGVEIPPGLLSLAMSVIAAAGEVKEYMVYHSRNVLNGLEKLGDIPAKDRQNAQVNAAIEIITDYTAIFMQSDGKEENFVAKCLAKTDTDLLVNHLARRFGINETDPAIVRQRIGEKINAFNETDENEKKSILAQYPELAKVNTMFRKFYGLLYQGRDELDRTEEKIGKRQGKLKAMGKIGTAADDNDERTLLPDEAASFPQQKNEQNGQQEGGAVKEGLASVFQFVQAFAEEVGGGVNQAVSQ